MNKTLGVVIVILALVGIFAIIGVSASNSEIKIKNQITAQQDVCKSYYDKLWKVLQQKAGVADQYRDAFAKIYPDLIKGRYGNEQGGSLMKLVQESNPNFDASLYKDLMSSIEAERAGFFMEQKKLIDLDREHKNIRQTFPSSMFIGSRPDVPITIVTSDKTDAVYTTGKENDVDLFKGGK